MTKNTLRNAMLSAGLAAMGAVLVWRLLGETPGDAAPEPRGEATAPKDVRVPARAAKPQLLVRVLGDDWATLMADVEVRIYPFDPRRMERPSEFLSARSDGVGLASFAGLRDGAAWVCGPGHEPGDDAPGSMRVEIRGDSAPVEVTVARKPKLQAIDLTIDAQFAPRDGFGTRLVLARIDDGSRREWPLPRQVQPGREQLRFAAPAGSYEILLRPLGDLLIEGGNSLLVIGERSDGQSENHRIALIENPSRTMVTLTGIPADALPVRVDVIPTERQDDRRHGLEWWGPTAWTSTTMQVAALTSPHRLVAMSRAGAWCSEDVILPGSAGSSIGLVPATRIVIVIESWEAPRDLEMVVDVAAGPMRYSRVLLPTFGPERPGLAAPALVGEVFVPRGREVSLTAHGADGAIAWRRSLRGEESEQVLRLAQSRSN